MKTILIGFVILTITACNSNDLEISDVDTLSDEEYRDHLCRTEDLCVAQINARLNTEWETTRPTTQHFYATKPSSIYSNNVSISIFAVPKTSQYSAELASDMLFEKLSLFSPGQVNRSNVTVSGKNIFLIEHNSSIHTNTNRPNISLIFQHDGYIVNVSIDDSLENRLSDVERIVDSIEIYMVKE